MKKFKKPKNINPQKGRIANLGKYAHPAKLPSGEKIGALVKTHTKSGKIPSTPKSTKSPVKVRSAVKSSHARKPGSKVGKAIHDSYFN